MLSPEERTRVIRRLETKKEVKFDELRGLLGLNDRDIFNLERGDRTKLKGMATDLLLAKKEYFGRQWAEFSEPLKNDIVRSLIEDPDTEVFRKAVDEWNCDQELAARLVDVGLEDGYMSVSRLAIEKLLPHLEQGLRYMGKDAHDSASMRRDTCGRTRKRSASVTTYPRRRTISPTPWCDRRYMRSGNWSTRSSGSGASRVRSTSSWRGRSRAGGRKGRRTARASASGSTAQRCRREDP